MNQRVFVFHQGALGDCILAVQALDQIASRPRFDICCQEQLGRLALYLGLAEHAFPIERACFSSLFSAKPHKEVVQLLAHYDGAILFTLSEELHHAVTPLVQGPVYRIPPRPQDQAAIHIVDFLLDRIREHFPLLGRQQNFITMADDGRSHSRPLLLHPGSGSFRKNWPLEKFIALGTVLKKHGFDCQWILGPAEHQFGPTVEASNQHSTIHRVDDLIDAAHLIRHACAFVGNDSGLSHLAAFVGIPTVAIFGPSSPVRWAPRGPVVSVVRSSLGCEPCFDTDVDCATLECLKSIQPQVVLDSVLSLIGYRGS